jgi:hypothetical protein
MSTYGFVFRRALAGYALDGAQLPDRIRSNFDLVFDRFSAAPRPAPPQPFAQPPAPSPRKERMLGLGKGEGAAENRSKTYRIRSNLIRELLLYVAQQCFPDENRASKPDFGRIQIGKAS